MLEYINDELKRFFEAAFFRGNLTLRQAKRKRLNNFLINLELIKLCVSQDSFFGLLLLFIEKFKPFKNENEKRSKHADGTVNGLLKI